jgi:hypothetical protein
MLVGAHLGRLEPAQMMSKTDTAEDVFVKMNELQRKSWAINGGVKLGTWRQELTHIPATLQVPEAGAWGGGVRVGPGGRGWGGWVGEGAREYTLQGALA